MQILEYHPHILQFNLIAGNGKRWRHVTSYGRTISTQNRFITRHFVISFSFILFLKQEMAVIWKLFHSKVSFPTLYVEEGASQKLLSSERGKMDIYFEYSLRVQFQILISLTGEHSKFQKLFFKQQIITFNFVHAGQQIIPKKITKCKYR